MSDTTTYPSQTMELKSLLGENGMVVLSVDPCVVEAPGENEVVVRVEAAPINPSDLGGMFAMADLAGAAAAGSGAAPAVCARVGDQALAAQRARVGVSMPIGNEGAGTVVAAGAGPEAQALMGKVVGFLSGNAYAGYRTLNTSQCLAMAEGTTPAQAASAFVNPLTALGMVTTMRAEGHSALVHTVGASNLGKMLNRICLADGIALVNIVRSPEQAAALDGLGAEYVCDSSQDGFESALTDALRATGATIAFDAIGGGEMASTLLALMERVASEGDAFSRYGSSVHKQVYIYGGLDRSPTLLRRNFGMSWSVGGWLLTPFLMNASPETNQRLRQRVADEITTTFASSYGMELSLADAVDPELVKRYGRMATGDKALITPQA